MTVIVLARRYVAFRCCCRLMNNTEFYCCNRSSSLFLYHCTEPLPDNIFHSAPRRYNPFCWPHSWEFVQILWGSKYKPHIHKTSDSPPAFLQHYMKGRYFFFFERTALAHHAARPLRQGACNQWQVGHTCCWHAVISLLFIVSSQPRTLLAETTMRMFYPLYQQLINLFKQPFTSASRGQRKHSFRAIQCS